LWVI
jgi:hypothetical protein